LEMAAASAPPILITLDDLRDAATTLRAVTVRTPLLPDETLSARIGVPVSVKPEMLQRGGAFKLRGAYNFLAKLSPEQRARGVVAPSSGNHAQAVALAARLFGVPATVVMPVTVTPAKRAGAERLGARVVLAGTTTADRMDKARHPTTTPSSSPVREPRDWRSRRTCPASARCWFRWAAVD
jgi:threonine dehydratase